MTRSPLYNAFVKPLSPTSAYILAPILVVMTAFVVQDIQHVCIAADHGAYSNPNLIAFLVPIVFITILGGKWPGWTSIALSAVVATVILLPPVHYLSIQRYADWVTLLSMIFAGSLIVFGIDITRQAAVAQIRITEEIEKLHERANRVATAFQEPLVPHISGNVEGLEIGYYYQPALDEALVGGDFLDVFSTNRGKTVLVLGDISGKGLAAATQVSVVRSMLRGELFDREPDTMAQAIARINEALAAQDLLTGFATVFLAIYDAPRRALTYASCGHEPAILRRVGVNAPEMLSATGTVLGAFRGGRFEQREISLSPGDTLVIYTDGLSEAGPDRRSMIGSIGLAAIVENTPESEPAERMIETLISQARDYANGELLDDACVLVCRATAPQAAGETARMTRIRGRTVGGPAASSSLQTASTGADPH